jgi:hypothetical protein
VKIIVLLVALLIASCATTIYEYDASMSFQEMKLVQSSQEKRSWSNPYFNRFLKEHNKHWPNYSFDCSREILNAGHTEIVLIFPLDLNGKILTVKSNPDIPEAQCFIDNLTKHTYPQPPVYAYYAGLRIYGIDTWEKP